MTLQGPRLYPDELVSSGLIRCCRRYGLTTKPLRSVVLEVPYWQSRFLCFNSLSSLARVFRVPEEIILWEHTTFPYASAFLDEVTYSKALECVAGEAAGSRLGAIAQNATVGGGFRRYCSECAAEDRANYGESYWHRAHNLPGVVVCHTHGRYLRASDIPVDMAFRLDLGLPSEGRSRVGGRRIPPQQLLRLAQASASALLSRPGSRPGPTSAEHYRAIAREHGWLQEGSQVSGLNLNRLLAQTFGDIFLDRWGVKPEQKESSWPSLMLRDRCGVPFVPLKHMLLDIALRSPRNESSLHLNHQPSGPSARRASELDAVASRSARAVLKALLASGETGVTTEAFLRQAGYFRAYRERFRELPRLRAVVLKFRAGSASVKRLSPGRKLYRSLPDESIPA